MASTVRTLGKIQIVVDSNEYHHGNTWVFPGYSISVRPLLKYGCDYSVRGQVGTIGVERKSFNDYVRCLGADWKRFQKQLAKLQRNRIHALIVEGSMDSPIYERSAMVLDAVINQTAKVVAMGIPVVFASTRHNAMLTCARFMHAAVRRIQDGL